MIVAIRIDEATACRMDANTKVKTERTMTGGEAAREGWFNGPPYAVEESVFDEYNLEACILTKEEQ